MTAIDRESLNLIEARSTWLHRLLTLGPKRVALTGNTILMDGYLVRGSSKIPIGTIDSISVHPSWFWHRLFIRLGNGTEQSVGGLDEEEAKRVRDAVIGEADEIAEMMSPPLKRLDEWLSQQFAGDRYARYSESLKIHDNLAPILRRCKRLVRRCLSKEAAEALARLAPLETLEKFESVRREANSLFVNNAAPTAQSVASETLRNPLTKEQAEAIATDEDVTLVLAGAGTGKTSVIVGKVAHLLRNQRVRPDQVLVLAFNRKAAGEVRARLKGELSATHVHTFHSFGRRVIAETEAAPTISKLATDDFALKRAVDQIIVDLLNDPKQSKAVMNFILYHHALYRSAFEFETYEEYEEHIRDVELRALSGDLVKSFEELEIANYLTEYGVEFRYEEPYKTREATRRHRQYLPDFFLPRHGIYIEHFALDEEGRAPRGWTGYAEGVEWKRRIHLERGSPLVETYSWQHRQGILLETLRRRLEDAGVGFNQVPRQELVQRLTKERVSWLAGLLATFLNHVKGGDISSSRLRARAKQGKNRWRSEGFLDVFDQVHNRYQRLLDDEEALDFHDLINLAAEHIRRGRWKSQYRYVLVDEFQDISSGRMALIRALGGKDVAFFLVGDDWQSIYRFAGSDIGLLSDCRNLLGHVEERTLSLTFRFGDGILGPSTAFVKRNPDQTQRPLISASDAENGGITVVAAASRHSGVGQALRDIVHKSEGNPRTVLVLGRYRQRRGDLQFPPRRRTLRLAFSTVHSSKGREADFVIVVDLNEGTNGRWGFPSKIEDDPLLDLVLPPVRGRAYPHAEERRLFYVAMTRARIGAYLVTDSMRPSSFVKELLSKSSGLRQIGEFAPKCPRCRRGVLEVINGRLGPFWGCTEYGSTLSCSYKKDIE